MQCIPTQNHKLTKNSISILLQFYLGNIIAQFSKVNFAGDASYFSITQHTLTYALFICKQTQPQFFLLDLLYLYVCQCVHSYVFSMTCVWRSEENVWNIFSPSIVYGPKKPKLWAPLLQNVIGFPQTWTCFYKGVNSLSNCFTSQYNVFYVLVYDLSQEGEEGEAPEM